MAIKGCPPPLKFDRIAKICLVLLIKKVTSIDKN